MFTLPLRPKNPFRYPGGRLPGIDRSHPAASKLMWSGICYGGNAINLVNGQPGVPTGSPLPVGAMDPVLGPCMNTQANFNLWSNFSGLPISPAGCPGTVAVLLRFNFISGSIMAIIGPGSEQLVFQLDAGNIPDLYLYSSTGGTGLILGPADTSGNVPYFLVASWYYSGGSVFATATLKNLNTGQIITGSSSGTGTHDAGDGTLTYGGGAFADNVAGNNAAGMWSIAYLSPAQQLAWAADPWSFWYPPVLEQIIAESVTGGPPPLVYPRTSTWATIDM